MDMLMKGDILKEQELYAKYSKYVSISTTKPEVDQLWYFDKQKIGICKSHFCS